MGIKYFFMLIFFFLISCSSGNRKFHYVINSEQLTESNRLPSSDSSSYDLSSEDIAKMRPVEILEYLSSNCCDSKLVETTEIKKLWTDDDRVALTKFLSDDGASSAVLKSTSSVHCQGEKFVSTVKREALHLLMAFDKGHYPVSQCSTFDLKINNLTP